MSAPQRERLFTTHQVAELIQMEPSSVVKWINEGLLVAYRTPGGHRRVRATDLVAFLRQHGSYVPPELSTRTLKVLFVDEDRHVLGAMTRAMKGYADRVEFLTASSGVEALVRVGAEKPDVLVLDIAMSQVDGFEVDQTSMPPPPIRPIVACLGSSTIHGKGQAYDLVGDLKARPDNASLTFLNLGVGGDLAFNTLHRVPEVVRAQPGVVVILVGGDDVLASVFPAMLRFLRLTKHLPREPAPEWYEQNLRDVVRQLRAQTPAAIALCSLVPLGEAPDSLDPVQHQLNALVDQYSAIIKRIAVEERVGYVPLYERLHAELVAAPGSALTELKLLPMYEDAFKTVVLHHDLDALGRERGYRFHTDGIHLNTTGGRLLANLTQEFLASTGAVSPIPPT